MSPRAPGVTCSSCLRRKDQSKLVLVMAKQAQVQFCFSFFFFFFFFLLNGLISQQQTCDKRPSVDALPIREKIFNPIACG